ncbi:MAG TPA: malto-oligosyltrehalose trehalohydrolase [Opitutaceae bacterium]|nr:malto-oligosyltrehalose trehalohydrolase [Opitutaceae bacterium]
MKRKFPIGAEIQPAGGVHFRVWAPRSGSAAIEFHAPGKKNDSPFVLEPEPGGYFSGLVPHARDGDRYKIRLDHGPYPDPASRFQPEGPHGPSQVVNFDQFPWTDQAWRGRERRDLVIYEMHIGTFTRDGTWRAAMNELPELKRIGVTLIEVMPIGEFPGNFGWGYDGVDLFAPVHLYGSPDDLRAFVNRAHELELMVILDVVYNHLGPEGNFVGQFSRDYFSATHQCEWGEAINFDGRDSGPVREFFITNARYWIEEFHFDGLRLDATQQIFDASKTHVLAEIAHAAHVAAGGRTIFLVAENEPQHARLTRPTTDGGYGLNALWNDDYHHAAMVAASGRAEAYYSDYRGTAQEFVSALKHGFLYQGQWHRWQKNRRGQPALGLPPETFVIFLQNHDQVANSLRGLRLHQIASPGDLRALTALTLLAPSIPMLFQGQEFSSSSPFLYFADHPEELRNRVSAGRRGFLGQFSSIACEESQAVLASPHDPATFQRCKLDFSERKRNETAYRLHIDLLKLRRDDQPLRHAARVDGAVLNDHAFVLRFFSATGDDRLLVVNLGTDFFYSPSPEPLLAPVENRGWSIRWSSESPGYAGGGTPALETTAGWRLPGHAAVLLQPGENHPLPDAKLAEKD